MENQIDFNLLLDFYGPLMTEEQRNIVEMYYSDDMSLSEIAGEIGTTRQAVQQRLKKQCSVLLGFEEKMGLVKKFSSAREIVTQIKNDAKELNFESASEIQELATKLLELF